MKPAYHKLQQSLHPDLYGGASDEQKELSADWTSVVNEAFSTLSKPYSRASYILRTYHDSSDVKETDMTMDPGFLMDIMEKACA